MLSPAHHARQEGRRLQTRSSRRGSPSPGSQSLNPQLTRPVKNPADALAHGVHNFRESHSRHADVAPVSTTPSTLTSTVNGNVVLETINPNGANSTYIN